MGEAWTLLLDLVAVLAAAFLAGALMEHFRQSAMLGYILAGVLLGPGAFGVVQSPRLVNQLAEAGVALLLFTIGLEFSLKQLRRLGKVATVGGALQVVGTLLTTMAIAMSFGLAWPPALALGAVVALSSTAIVLRVLYERGDIDSPHGKYSLGILLFQDVALVGLVLLVTALGGGTTSGHGGFDLGVLITGIAMFIGAFLIVLPGTLKWRGLVRNRELPILLAVVVCMGATWGAHRMGLSPALGAFVAGVLLAESPYAGQIRADVAPLRALFVALFFASVGMLADLRWIVSHSVPVLGLALALILGKALIVTLVLRVLGFPTIASVAAGIVLAQIGEFSFVLVQTASGNGLLEPSQAQLITSASIVTILVCPWLVGEAPRIARALALRVFPARQLAQEEQAAASAQQTGHILVAGFGEAGRAAVRRLVDGTSELRVIDIDADLVRRAQRKRIPASVGDATSAEILLEAGILHAAGLVVAVPDFGTSRLIVQQARSIAPDLPIVVRGRYSAFNDQLLGHGASAIVDEERETGRLLADLMLTQLDLPLPTTRRLLATEVE